MLALRQAQAVLSDICRAWLDEQPLHTQYTAIDASLNLSLADDVYAQIDVPYEAVSAMDGYALCLNHITGGQCGELFHISGESRAGAPLPTAQAAQLQAGQCVRITTGAVVPAATHTVIMQEDVEIIPAQNVIRLQKNTHAQQNIRAQAEEIYRGQLLFLRGERITPNTVSALASQGIDRVLTYKPLRVGFFSSGDELIRAGETLRSGTIFESNLSVIQALLGTLPLELFNLGIVADTPEHIKSCLQNACSTMDVVISSGGVSVGDYDYIRDVVDHMGSIQHYKVAIKPGKPLCFGHLQHDHHSCLFFGLPGNPVSTFVTLQNFFIPCLWQLSHCANPPQKMQLSATLSNALHKRSGRTEFQRGILNQQINSQGHIHWLVSAMSDQDSHRIYNLAQANCHIVLEQHQGNLEAGSMVTVEPFPWCFNL